MEEEQALSESDCQMWCQGDRNCVNPQASVV